MYSDMATLQIMDTIFYEAQRQGRISFYLTTIGEEAINIASAAALTIDDFVVPQVTRTSVHVYFLTIFSRITPTLFYSHTHKHTHSNNQNMCLQA